MLLRLLLFYLIPLSNLFQKALDVAFNSHVIIEYNITQTENENLFTKFFNHMDIHIRIHQTIVSYICSFFILCVTIMVDCICSYVFQFMHKSKMKSKLWYFHPQQNKFTRQVKKLGSKYREVKLYRLRKEVKINMSELLPHRNSIFENFVHPNLLMQVLPNDILFYTSLEYFMFDIYDASFSPSDNILYDHFPNDHFAAMVLFMRDVLNAIQFLHDRRICHLDLVPKNILVMNTLWKNKDGCGMINKIRGYTAKVGGFKFAKYCDDSKVSWKEVGLDKFRRPPEYLNDGNEELDAVKVDYWSIGITSYELFTGGMLSISSELQYACIPTFNELAKTTDIMDFKYFAAAMEERWKIHNFTKKRIYFYHTCFDMYEMELTEFATDCWNFVQGFLKLEAEERTSIEHALKTPLIKKIRKTPRCLLWAMLS